MVPDVGFAAPGVLFLADEATRALLDRKEGHPRYYERRAVTVLREGRPVPALTWSVVPRRRVDHVPPTPEYQGIVLGAWQLWKLPMPMLFDAIGGHPRPIDRCFVYGNLCTGHQHAHRLAGFRERCHLPHVVCADVGSHAALHLGHYEGFQGVDGELVFDVPELVETLTELDAQMHKAGLRRTLLDVYDGVAWAWVDDRWSLRGPQLTTWPAVRPPTRLARWTWSA